ncbi:Gamma-aminobutyric acid type B receptor subunit 2 [Podila clonocystis]|nr:Gamma-aminobutyric acid type B receptor subunit 2 [Podila clonocystis]
MGGRPRTRLARGRQSRVRTPSLALSIVVIVVVLFLLAVVIPHATAQIPEDHTTSDPSVSVAPPKELFPGILDPGPHPNNTLRFGILMPLNLTKPEDAFWKTLARNTITAIRLAVEDINAEKMLPVNISLSIRSSQPPDNNEQSGSNAMLQAALFVTNNISAILGDTRSWLTEYSATLTSSLRIPQCSFTSASDALSSKILYDYFIRTVATTEVLAQQYLDYIRLMGWRRLGIIYSDDSFGRSLNNDITRFAQDYGVTITISEAIYIPHTERNNIDPTLRAIRQSGSYINMIATTDTTVMRAIHDIYSAGMYQLPYVWLTLNNLEESIHEVYDAPGAPHVLDFDGLVMLGAQQILSDNPHYVKFQKRWANLNPDLYPGAGVNEDLIHAETRAYSCVRIIALAYQKDIELARARGVSEQHILQELLIGSYPRTIGDLSSDLFSTLEYDGPAGKIKMDRYGNTVSVGAMFFQMQQGVAVVVAKTLPWQDTRSQKVQITGAQYWPHLRAGSVPKDSPPWVLQNIAWTEPIAWVMMIIAGLGMITCMMFIGIVIWKRDNPVIKASSAFFCVLELIGIMIGYTVVPMRIGNFSDFTCSALSIVLTLGLSILLGSLVVKNLRIYRIFNNVFQNKYAISDMKLFRQLVVIVFFFTLSPLIYAIVVKPKVRYIAMGPTKAAYACVRTNTHMANAGAPVYGAVSLLPILLLLAVAGFLAYQTQNVSSRWNESRQIIYTIYTMLLTFTIFLPTMFLANDQFRVTLVTQNIVVLFALTMSLLILFVPKLVLMRRLKRESEESPEAHPTPWGPEGRRSGGLPVQQSYDQSDLTFGKLAPLQSLTSDALTSGDSDRERRKSSSTIYPSIPLQSITFTREDADAQGADTAAQSITRNTQVEGDAESLSRERTQSAGMMSMQSGTIFDSHHDSACDLGVYSFGPSDDTQMVPVQVEYRGWLYRSKKPWKLKRFILVSSLATVILADEARTTLKTYLYTRVTSITERGHYYLYVTCLDYTRLKIEFPNDVARDQWLLAFDAPSKETADATLPTIARRLSMRARLKAPRSLSRLPSQNQQLVSDHDLYHDTHAMPNIASTSTSNIEPSSSLAVPSLAPDRTDSELPRVTSAPDTVHPMTEYNMDRFLNEETSNSATPAALPLSAQPPLPVSDHSDRQFSFLDALRLEETDPTEIPDPRRAQSGIFKRIFQS